MGLWAVAHMGAWPAGVVTARAQHAGFSPESGGPAGAEIH